MVPDPSGPRREASVVWFDNRGAGESDTTRRVTVPELAADAGAVMDAAGLERAHVFGISMGGVIAIELALQQPYRATSLVLGGTGILSADKPRLPAFLSVAPLPATFGSCGDWEQASAAVLDFILGGEKGMVPESSDGEEGSPDGLRRPRRRVDRARPVGAPATASR